MLFPAESVTGSSSLSDFYRFGKVRLGVSRFRTSAFRKRKRTSRFLVMDRGSSGSLKIDPVVYIKRLLVLHHNTSSSKCDKDVKQK